MNPETLLAEFDFPLPEERIARYPADRRELARLLLIDRSTGKLSDHTIQELPDLLQPDDLLIRNTTRVSWRKVLLQRSSGGLLPALFLEATNPTRPSLWKALVKRTRRLENGELLTPPGETGTLRFRFQRGEEGSTQAWLEALRPDPANPEELLPAWETPDRAESFFLAAGHVPLPPYLKRESEELDRIRYQTVYARNPGSVAAPTAGLHFTEELIGELEKRGVGFADLELRIGYGTFAPLQEENFRENRLHPEEYRIDPQTAELLNSSRRKIAVGTTSLRALEDSLRKGGDRFLPGDHTTTIFLYPPARCRATEGLLTNFHLPGSSLILLVASFLGKEHTLRAYKHALENDYRFFSYGDAMLIL